jgi:glycosyltransferase
VSSHINTLGVVTCSRSDLPGLSRTLESLKLGMSSFQQLVLVLTDYSDSEIQTLIADYSILNPIFILAESKGIYQAMNLGCADLETQLVLFLNGGDELIDSGALIELTNLVKSDGWGYGGIQIASVDNKTLRNYQFSSYSKKLHRFAIKYVPHPATVFSVQTLRQFGGYNLSYSTAADQDLILRFARFSDPTVINKTIAKFYLGGQSTRSNRKTIAELRRISKNEFGNTLDSEVIDKIVWGAISLIRFATKKILSTLR